MPATRPQNFLNLVIRPSEHLSSGKCFPISTSSPRAHRPSSTHLIPLRFPPAHDSPHLSPILAAFHYSAFAPANPPLPADKVFCFCLPRTPCNPPAGMLLRACGKTFCSELPQPPSSASGPSRPSPCAHKKTGRGFVTIPARIVRHQKSRSLRPAAAVTPSHRGTAGSTAREYPETHGTSPAPPPTRPSSAARPTPPASPPAVAPA